MSKEIILERIADVIEYNYSLDIKPKQDGDALQFAIDSTAKALIKLTETQYQMEFETEIDE